MELECIETNYPSMKALRKAAGEFEVYVPQQRMDDSQLCRAAALRRTRIHRIRGKRHQYSGGQAIWQASTDAVVKARCASHAAGPDTYPRRHAQGEVRAVVPRTEGRRQFG